MYGYYHDVVETTIHSRWLQPPVLGANSPGHENDLFELFLSKDISHQLLCNVTKLKQKRQMMLNKSKCVEQSIEMYILSLLSLLSEIMSSV